MRFGVGQRDAVALGVAGTDEDAQFQFIVQARAGPNCGASPSFSGRVWPTGRANFWSTPMLEARP